jgi:hypothetical protein
MWSEKVNLVMDEGEVVSRAVAVMASDIWWRPILGFIITNCSKFSGLDFTNEEHDCFIAFRKLFSELFDSYLAGQIGVKGSKLEAALAKALKCSEPRATIAMGILKKYSDFVFFRDEMIKMAEKVNQETANRILEIRDAAEGENSTKDVVAWLEEGEKAFLERETHERVWEMEEELRVACEDSRITKEAVQKPKVKATLSQSQGLTIRGAQVIRSSSRGQILKPNVLCVTPRGL